MPSADNIHQLLLMYHFNVQSVKYMSLCIFRIKNTRDYCMALRNLKSNGELDNIM